MPPTGDKREGRLSWRRLAGAALAVLAVALVVWQRDVAWQLARQAYVILSDPGRTQAFIQGFGAAAPMVFIAVQVAQVVIAPIPGEVTGFIGGYLFGTLAGFVYSSAALTAGSLINFGIGRRLGRRFVARHVSPERLQRFDRLFHDRGVVVVFILFLFPGFPKDYFCLFLGLTSLPLRLMVLMAAIGRMPGTLMLSLQGAAVFSRDYRTMVAAGFVTLAAAAAVVWFRDPLTRWAERLRRQ